MVLLSEKRGGRSWASTKIESAPPGFYSLDFVAPGLLLEWFYGLIGWLCHILEDTLSSRTILGGRGWRQFCWFVCLFWFSLLCFLVDFVQVNIWKIPGSMVGVNACIDCMQMNDLSLFFSLLFYLIMTGMRRLTVSTRLFVRLLVCLNWVRACGVIVRITWLYSI